MTVKQIMEAIKKLSTEEIGELVSEFKKYEQELEKEIKEKLLELIQKRHKN